MGIFRRTHRQSIVASGLLLLATFLLAGCESDGGNGAEMPTDGVSASSSAPEDPNFPDGVHPSGEACVIIAKVFGRQIVPRSDAGGNAANTVVCLGDSITARGYPPYLADETGMNVVNEGIGSELSASTARRAPGVLARHRPDYLCVLIGANDVVAADATIEGLVANIESIVNAAKASGAIPIVATLTPLSGPRREWAGEARAASAAIRSMARRTGTRLADLEAAF